MIDVTALAEAVKAIGATIAQSGQQTQNLIASLQSAQILTALADVQEKARQNEIVENTLKFAAIAGAGWFIWRKVL